MSSNKISIYSSQRNKKPTVEWFTEVIIEVLELAKQEEAKTISQQQSIQSLDSLVKKEIKLIEGYNFYFPSNFGWDENSWHFKLSEQKIESTKTTALNFLEKQKERIEKEHLVNIDAIANNKLIVEGLTKMFDKFGIRRSWSEYSYKSSRSRSKTQETKYSTWPTDLTVSIPTSDGYESLLRTIQSQQEQIAKWVEAQTKKLKEQEKVEQQKNKELDKTKWLAYFQIKYKLSPESNWSDVLQEILQKDKYLMLAYYLQKNRGDWNDGSYYAEIGLDLFKIENDRDQTIVNDIQYQIDEWDGDGRCFRDCEWNYGVLFGLVENQELVTDLNKCEEFIN